jgi:hypothetical protein
MARTSTTAKLSRTSLNLIADWIRSFRQGVVIRHKGKEVAYHGHKSERDTILRDRTYTIRKSTLATIAHELSIGSLCTAALILRSLIGADSTFEIGNTELARIGTRSHDLPTDSGQGFVFPDLSFGQIDWHLDHYSFSAYTISLPRYFAYLEGPALTTH